MPVSSLAVQAGDGSDETATSSTTSAIGKTLATRAPSCTASKHVQAAGRLGVSFCEVTVEQPSSTSGLSAVLPSALVTCCGSAATTTSALTTSPRHFQEDGICLRSKATPRCGHHWLWRPPPQQQSRLRVGAHDRSSAGTSLSTAAVLSACTDSREPRQQKAQAAPRLLQHA